MRKKTVFLACLLGIFLAVAFRIACAQASHLIPPLPQVTILVDDFQLQPLQGDSILIGGQQTVSQPLPPLNNVESLTFPAGSSCAAENVEWNSLKSSWNLALQTLGWGRYLAEQDGKIPAGWQATLVNPFLRGGYLVLAPGGVRIVYLPVLVG